MNQLQRSHHQRNRTSFLVLLLLGISMLALFCGELPPDPNTPSNASVSLLLRSSSNKYSSEFIEDTIGNTLSVGCLTRFSRYIDSIQVKIVNISITSETMVYSYTAKDLTVDTLWKTISFATAGTRKIYSTSYITGGGLKLDTATVTILNKPQINHKPELVITGNRTVISGDSLTLTVIVNDSDLTQTHTYSLLKAPLGAVFNQPLFTWKSKSNFSGTDTVIFVVTDNGSPVLADADTVIITTVQPKLAQPVHFRITSTLNSVISFAWDSVPLATNYTLYRSSVISGPFSELKSTTSTSSTDSIGVAKFFYYVIARNATGISKPSDTIESTDTLNTKPNWKKDTVTVSVKVGSTYTLNLTDTSYDREGDTLTYLLLAGKPATDTIINKIYRITPVRSDTGNHSVKIIVQDKAKRSDTLSVMLKVVDTLVIKETKGPEILVLKQVRDSMIVPADSLTLTIRVKDSSGVASVRCSLTTFAFTTNIVDDSTYSALVKGLVAGRYSLITITAVDVYGNRSLDSLYVKFDNDRGQPRITLSAPSRDSTSINSTSSTVRVLCKDSSGIASVSYTYNGTTVAATHSPGDSIWSATISGLAENVFTAISVIATDASLAANKDTLNFVIKYDPSIEDSTGPQIISKSGLATGSRVANPIITIIDSIIDPSGIDSCYWSVNGVRAGYMTKLTTVSTYQLIDTLTIYHTNRIVIYATDKSPRHNLDSMVVVLDYNVAPVIRDTTVQTNKNKSTTLTLKAVSPDNDTIIWSRVTEPHGGQITGTLPQLTYVPSNNFYGTDSFYVKGTDGFLSDTAIVKISVVNVNYPPVVKDTAVATTKNVPVVFDLSGSDPDGTALSGWTIITQPKKGTAILATSPINRVTYTPANNVTGSDTFQFVASDGALSDTGVVVITIMSANYSPVAKDTAVTVSEDTPLTIALSATDPDSTVLTAWSLLKQGSKGVATLGTTVPNSLTYSPDLNISGKDTISFVVSDGILKDTGYVIITVASVNDAPLIAKNLGVILLEGGNTAISSSRLDFSDVDNASSNLMITVSALPKNGTLTLAGVPVSTANPLTYSDCTTGTLVYTHNGSETLSDSILFTVSDGLLSTPGSFKITVSAVNDAPVFSKTGLQMVSGVVLGSVYRDTIVLADPENAYRQMQLTMTPSAVAVTFDSTSGKIILNWNVDFTKYMPTQVVPCSLSVLDGTVERALTWNVTIGRHIWTKVLTNVNTSGLSIADSFNVYAFTSMIYGVSDALRLQILKCDIRAGQTYSSYGILNTGMSGFLSAQLKCRGGLVALKSYTAINALNASSVVSFNTSFTYSEFGGFSLSSDGHVYYTKNTNEARLIFRDSTQGYSQARIIPVGAATTPSHMFFDLSIQDAYTYVISAADSTPSAAIQVLRFTNPWWSGTSSAPLQSGVVGLTRTAKFVSDNNNGDTLYLTDYANNVSSIKRLVNTASSASFVPTIQDLPNANALSPSSLTMYNGSTGWFTSNGSLYFTSNGFATAPVTEELEPGVAVSPSMVLISGDGKAVFAVANGSLYRY